MGVDKNNITDTVMQETKEDLHMTNPDSSMLTLGDPKRKRIDGPLGVKNVGLQLDRLIETTTMQKMLERWDL